MSKGIYEVTFDTAGVLRQIQLIRQQLQRNIEQTGRPVEPGQVQRLGELNWKPIANDHKIEIPARMFEVRIPPEFTEDVGVKDEVALISLEDQGIRVMLTDASLPVERCDKVASRIAKKIYEDATGRKLRPEQVVVKGTAAFTSAICERCKETLDTFPYACTVCGRCFCYDHKQPEIHGCQHASQTRIDEDTTRPREKPTAKRRGRYTPTKHADRTRPAVTVTKVPCG